MRRHDRPGIRVRLLDTQIELSIYQQEINDLARRGVITPICRDRVLATLHATVNLATQE
jgi:hypothetical protein